MSKEEVIVVDGRKVRTVSELRTCFDIDDDGPWWGRVQLEWSSSTEVWEALPRSTRAAARRDRDLMLSALRQMADGYVAPPPEQLQALSDALMDVERYKALHLTAAAGWQQATDEAREAHRALRIMSLRLHDVEMTLLRSYGERDEARRALGVRDGGAS